MTLILSFSAPVAGAGGLSLGSALGTASAAPAPTTTTTPSLGLGGSIFGQKATGGFSFNTPASSNDASQIKTSPWQVTEIQYV